MQVDVADAWDVAHAELQGRQGALAAQFRSGVPFPHVVIDGAFPDVLLTEVLA